MNIQKTRRQYLKRDRKAVSPVISTIIIVAIAIAISIAVALYLTGITTQFTKFERLDVTSAYVSNGITTISVKNSGTSQLSIDMVMINGKPETTLAADWTPSSDDTIPPTTAQKTGIVLSGSGGANNIILIGQGDSGQITFSVTGKSGQSIELTFHTVSGKEYPKVVVLP